MGRFDICEYNCIWDIKDINPMDMDYISRKDISVSLRTFIDYCVKFHDTDSFERKFFCISSCANELFIHLVFNKDVPNSTNRWKVRVNDMQNKFIKERLFYKDFSHFISCLKRIESSSLELERLVIVCELFERYPSKAPLFSAIDSVKKANKKDELIEEAL